MIPLVEMFQKARKDENLAVLEGVHALKHALRFDAHIVRAVSGDTAGVFKLLDAVAPDVRGKFKKVLEEIPEEIYQQLAPHSPRTGVIAISERPLVDAENINNGGARVVFLDNPRDSENVGAVVRVAAAAKAGGVVITGDLDPWSPACIRGSAGLHFALPVMRTKHEPFDFGSPVVVFDPDGSENELDKLPSEGVFVFGSERYGVSKSIKEGADILVRIPMQKKVSSLNLATSVAVALYCA